MLNNQQITKLNWQGILAIFYGLAGALIILLILSFGGSALIYFSDLPEQSLYLIAVIINLIAMFGGGFLAGRKGENKGLWRGLSIGIIMLLIMLFTGNLGMEQIAAKAGYCLPAAALGGVFGIKN